MPYKKHKPWPHAKMMRERYKGHHTICAKLKDLYQATDDQDIRRELAICVSMAKSMHEKLKYYKIKEAENEH